MKKFQIKHTITFGDCDPAQIVFYPNYFKWFDQATEQMFRALGQGWEHMFPGYGLGGLPIVDASASFKGPARLGDEIIIESWVEEWRGKSFVVQHRILNGDNEIATGQEIRVWAVKAPDSPKGIKAVDVPDEIMALFTA
ncbi:MAG: thioesterase family protein [Proteobacteria bacterium]|nr:thioesterase family protein [Pseudomonadota bacterium]